MTLTKRKNLPLKEYGWSPRTFEVGELVEETAYYYVFSKIVDGKIGSMSAVLKADGRTGPYPFPQGG